MCDHTLNLSPTRTAWVWDMTLHTCLVAISYYFYPPPTLFWVFHVSRMPYMDLFGRRRLKRRCHGLFWFLSRALKWSAEMLMGTTGRGEGEKEGKLCLKSIPRRVDTAFLSLSILSFFLPLFFFWSLFNLNQDRFPVQARPESPTWMCCFCAPPPPFVLLSLLIEEN